MPVVGRGDFYSVNVAPFQQFAEVGVRIAAFVFARWVLFGIKGVHHAAGRFAPRYPAIPVARAFPVHVAYGDYLYPLVAQKVARISGSLIARADDAQCYAIGRRYMPVTPQCARRHYRRRGNCACCR